MRVLLQRVSRAAVYIEGQLHNEIGKGLLVLLGIAEDDKPEDLEWLVNKIVQLRVFSDVQGKMNKSLIDINGQTLVISQFTLHAKVKKGTRPSFTKSASPEVAIPLYKSFISKLNETVEVKTGVFGANMQIELVNDGPVTIWLDSKRRE